MKRDRTRVRDLLSDHRKCMKWPVVKSLSVLLMHDAKNNYTVLATPRTLLQSNKNNSQAELL